MVCCKPEKDPAETSVQLYNEGETDFEKGPTKESRFGHTFARMIQICTPPPHRTPPLGFADRDQERAIFLFGSKTRSCNVYLEV